MTFDQTVAYLYSRLPMFQRQGPVALRRYDLETTRSLCAALGDPQAGQCFIHVGGTNGKGSVASMLCAALQAAGCPRVGLYTSPHLACFTERFRLNGQPAPQAWVVDFVRQHRELIESLEPSFFELTTAMAFFFFKEKACEVSVIEVGLGGRLDSTNIIDPQLTVVTRIGYDHMDLLGHTLPEIAAEKAGIFKAGVPAVVGQRQAQCAQVFEEVAARVGAPLTFASDRWSVEPLSAAQGAAWASHAGIHSQVVAHYLVQTITGEVGLVPLSLLGSYQRDNLATVLEAVRVWNGLRGQVWPISNAALRAGLGQVGKLSGLRGRFEVWPGQPPVVLDVAHNPEGIGVLVAQLNGLCPPDRQCWVFGVVQDKVLADVVPMLPAGARFVCTAADVPRARAAADVAAQLSEAGLAVEVVPAVVEAFEVARRLAPPDGVVVVAGSVFVVAEVLAAEDRLRQPLQSKSE